MKIHTKTYLKNEWVVSADSRVPGILLEMQAPSTIMSFTEARLLASQIMEVCSEAEKTHDAGSIDMHVLGDK